MYIAVCYAPAVFFIVNLIRAKAEKRDYFARVTSYEINIFLTRFYAYYKHPFCLAQNIKTLRIISLQDNYMHKQGDFRFSAILSHVYGLEINEN